TAFDRLLLLRHVNHAESALAKFLQELVTPERLAHGLSTTVREIHLDARTVRVRTRGARSFARLRRRQHRLDALTHCEVHRAGTAQESRACGEREFARLVRNQVFSTFR